MGLSKLKNDNGVYLYEDHNFNTITVQLYFNRKRGNKDDAISEIMCEYINKCNQVYSNVDSKKKELFSTEAMFADWVVGGVAHNILFAEMVSPSKTGVYYLDDAFSFLKDFVFKPDFTNKKMFEMVKRSYISNIEYALSSTTTKAARIYMTSTFDNEDDKFSYSTDLDYITEIVNSVTLEDIEKAYNEMMSEENFYRGLVFGDITEEEFKKFRESFPLKSDKEDLNYIDESPIIDGDKEISDPNANESIIYITYSIEGLDQKFSDILSKVFNGLGRICLSVFRDKYGLVYSGGLGTFYFKDAVYFYAPIHKDDKEKFLKAVDEVLAIAMNKDTLKKYLDLAKFSIKNEAYILNEEKYDFIDTIDEQVRGSSDEFDYEKFAAEIDEYTEEEFIDTLKTLKRRGVFMYRGELGE